MFLEINNLSKKIKNSLILDNINIKFESDKIYGLQGKNGCGKTMLIRLICGLIIPTNGKININGEILHKDISFPRSIGALIENPQFLPNYTGFKNLQLLSDIKNKINKEDIYDTLIKVGLDPNDKRLYHKYSLGMKQKLGIAFAIIENPEIIILDEPFNALDESSMKKISKVITNIKSKERIIIIVSHDREELESISDEIIKIDCGRIVNENKIT